MGDHRSSPSKGFREKEHYSRKEERFVHMQEDDLKESKDDSHPEEVDAEKKKKGTSDNSQGDPAPIMNALQMLQFGLKLNRKSESAVSEEPENSETPAKDKKAKKKEKKEKEKKAKEEKKERERLMELFEDEKRLL